MSWTPSIPALLAFMVSIYTVYTTKFSKSQATVSEDRKTTLDEKKLEFAHEESQIATLLREVADYRQEFKDSRAEREVWHAERLYLTQLILSLRTRIERLLIVLEKNDITVPPDILVLDEQYDPKMR